MTSIAIFPERLSGSSFRYFASGKAKVTRSLARAATSAVTALAPGAMTSTRSSISAGGRVVATRTSYPAFNACRASAVPTRPAPRTPTVRIGLPDTDCLLVGVCHPKFRVDERLDLCAQQFDRVQELLLRKMSDIYLKELPYVPEPLMQRDDALGDLLSVTHE